MKKKRKTDEAHLWAELSGLESAIRDLIQRRGEIAMKLQHIEIEKVRAQQAAGKTS